MDNNYPLISQVAATQGCTPNKIKIALYLNGLAGQSCTVDRAAALMRMKANTIKKYSREFMIDFADYRPFAKLEEKGKQRPDPKFGLTT